jgi:phosphatidylserine decarboxylase
VQITGLVARRIVCHAREGEWLAKGVRYGLIRFGSRTDVLLPSSAEPRVAVGDRVRGGQDVVARLPAGAGRAP